MTPPVDYSALIFPIPVGRVRAFLGQSGLSLEQWGPNPDDGEATLRYLNFAEANGLTFRASADTPGYPGMIFGLGHTRGVANSLRSTSGTFLDISNYHYSEGVGDREPRSWGYMALRLGRRLPHMVLDSRQNNGVFGIATNLPGFLDRHQVLSLEGDFDEHFTLYCPREYERDALYIFTPDLMALLIDNAAPFDVEIVDDWMFIYSTRLFHSFEPQTYLRLFTIVETVHRRALKRAARYSDERAASFEANVVAPPGKRLKPDVLASALDVRAASFEADVVGGPGKLLKPGVLASALIGAAIVLAIPVIMLVTFWIFDR